MVDSMASGSAVLPTTGTAKFASRRSGCSVCGSHIQDGCYGSVGGSYIGRKAMWDRTRDESFGRVIRLGGHVIEACAIYGGKKLIGLVCENKKYLRRCA